MKKHWQYWKKWKWIKGYKGIYAVSVEGKVKSFHSHGTRGKLKKLTVLPNGYIAVCFSSKDGSQKRFYVHRLVAEAFIPKVRNKKCINHRNGTKADNRAENLEWCNHSENNLHYQRFLKPRREIYNTILASHFQ